VTVAGSSAEAADGIRREVDDGLIRFARADLPLLPFPDRAFDAVVCVRLLAHCARWRELVAELCRTARNAVIVDYPARRSVNALAFALFGLKKRVEGNTRPYALFRDGQVRREFARCGFAVGARRPQFFFPLVLHRALRARRLSAAMETAAARVFLTAAFGSPVLVRAAREGGEK
jgi:2-polyprenyl-3-methyl-5-hydroxy-6-metoxy-1,4-benzoquinol methylase